MKLGQNVGIGPVAAIARSEGAIHPLPEFGQSHRTIQPRRPTEHSGLEPVLPPVGVCVQDWAMRGADSRGAMREALQSGALEHFSAPARSWFGRSFRAPTPAQEAAWSSIRSGDSALVVAPTGSGKTLAAFFWALDV